MTAPVGSCRCGHDGDAHEHYREGTNCALCGCRAFHQSDGRPPVSPELRRLLGITFGVPLGVVAVAAVATWSRGGEVPMAVAVLLAVAGGVATCWLIRPRRRDHDDKER